jgi:hypothetical protein
MIIAHELYKVAQVNQVGNGSHGLRIRGASGTEFSPGVLPHWNCDPDKSAFRIKAPSGMTVLVSYRMKTLYNPQDRSRK